MVTPFNKYFCFANLPLEEQQICCWTEMLDIIFYVDWYLNSQKACCVQPCPLSLFGNFGKFSNYTLIIFCFPFFVCVLLLFSWLPFNHGHCEQHIFPRAAGVRRHYNICAKHFELFSIKAMKLTQINNRAFPIARWENRTAIHFIMVNIFIHIVMRAVYIFFLILFHFTYIKSPHRTT